MSHSWYQITHIVLRLMPAISLSILVGKFTKDGYLRLEGVNYSCLCNRVIYNDVTVQHNQTLCTPSFCISIMFYHLTLLHDCPIISSRMRFIFRCYPQPNPQIHTLSSLFLFYFNLSTFASSRYSI